MYIAEVGSSWSERIRMDDLGIKWFVQNVVGNKISPKLAQFNFVHRKTPKEL